MPRAPTSWVTPQLPGKCPLSLENTVTFSESWIRISWNVFKMQIPGLYPQPTDPISGATTALLTASQVILVLIFENSWHS